MPEYAWVCNECQETLDDPEVYTIGMLGFRECDRCGKQCENRPGKHEISMISRRDLDYAHP
jgi:methionyl-tRNA synthetase